MTNSDNILNLYPVKSGKAGSPKAKFNGVKSKILNLPKKPGVYLFKNKDGVVLYVGKAKNLKARVRQYLSGHDEREQIPFLMAEAVDLDYTVVNNELESLYLENTLIKQYLPKYNILLRDDKNYAFIKIDYSTEIPQIGYARKIDNRPESTNYTRMTRKNANSDNSDGIRVFGSRYFGPYTAAYKIRNTLHLMRKIFPYCSALKVSGKPCFYYHLHRCPGVCVGKITLDEYRLHLKKIEDFLAGNTGKISKQLQSEMRFLASKKQFEKAARLRDQLNSLKLLEEYQTVILAKKVDWDIVSMAQSDGYACVNLFKVRGGKLQDKENFIYSGTNTPVSLSASRGGRMHPNDTNLAHSDNSPQSYDRATRRMTVSDAIRILGSVIQKFLEQYYSEASSIPKIIYTQYQIQEYRLIEKLIRTRCGRAIKIITPQKGKAKKLVKLGAANAQEYLTKWLSEQAGNLDKINRALQGLKDALNLEKIPQRIECYDISNIQGTNAVGSMVVFNKGLPAKSEYRKFKIRTKQTPDDFAMMKEMLERRLSRLHPSPPAKGEYYPKGGEGVGDYNLTPTTPSASRPPLLKKEGKTAWPLPDLIVIDGGKGQLGVAVETINNSRLTINVVGLAKRIEEIFVPQKSNPIILSPDDPALQLLQRLRDEAHRFGITFHRNLRSKQAVKSALDDIPGIGPKTKKLLKAKFGTVADIRKTKFDDLAAVVGEHIAQLIQLSL